MTISPRAQTEFERRAATANLPLAKRLRAEAKYTPDAHARDLMREAAREIEWQWEHRKPRGQTLEARLRDLHAAIYRPSTREPHPLSAYRAVILEAIAALPKRRGLKT